MTNQLPDYPIIRLPGFAERGRILRVASPLLTAAWRHDMRIPVLASACAAGLIAAVLTAARPTTLDAFLQTPAFQRVTDDVLQNPPASDWLHWRRTYDGWGHSPLTQINRQNVGQLRLAWSWAMQPGNQQV